MTIILGSPLLKNQNNLLGNMFMQIMLTGLAGIIGNYLELRLLQRADEVVGIDNLIDYTMLI